MSNGIIKLDTYVGELSAISLFYEYSETALKHQDVLKKVFLARTMKMAETLEAFKKNEETQLGEAAQIIVKGVANVFPKELAKGFSILRQQLLVAVHSLFEQYLCHVIKIYFYKFPQLLKCIKSNDNKDASLSYKDIVDRRDGSEVLEFIVEKELKRFSFAGLDKIIRFMKKQMRIEVSSLVVDRNVWVWKGKESWKDIDKRRHDIVHKEAKPNISKKYLEDVVSYIQRTMSVIAYVSQAEKGIPFEFPILAEQIKIRETPQL